MDVGCNGSWTTVVGDPEDSPTCAGRSGWCTYGSMTNTPICLLALFLSASRADAAAPSPAAQAPSTPASISIAGVVHDAGGGVVTGATVVLRLTSGAERQAITGAD